MRLPKTAQVVIGAHFGDEGKGVVTDHYAAQIDGNGIVVRFNGGAQAGHTVVTPDGLRHVFSHFGSGTLAGAATFLSRFFVSNPILFLKEQAVLAGKGMTRPTIYVDPHSPVTTPYDMLINQIVEQGRGEGRHGSCGVGFGETIERNLTPDYALTVGDLTDTAVLMAKLDAIRRRYVPVRLARLGFGDAFAHNVDLFLNDAILEHFVADTQHFLGVTTLAGAGAATNRRQVIFEGAQGLLLDQDRGFFPHVTRSNTGLRNVLALTPEMGIERLEVTYVTRAYLTRHGAGPLPHELPEKPYPEIVDATNVSNAYQGSLRFAWLDLDRLKHAVADDISDAGCSPTRSVKTRLAVTCLDQIGDEPVTYYRNGHRRQEEPEAFVAAAAATLGVDNVLAGFGADRRSLRPLAVLKTDACCAWIVLK